MKKELNPDSTYFDFQIDPTLARRTEILCMYSIDDEQDVLKSVHMTKSQLPDVEIVEFTDKGHFTEASLDGKEFPELLDVIL